MGIKFIRQTDKFRCAPVAMINAFKYFSLPYSKKDLKKLSKKLNTRPKKGTRHNKIDAFVNKHFKSTFYEVPSIRTLEKHLKNKPILFVCPNLTKTSWHISLMIKSNSRYFYIVNFYKNQTISKVTKNNINKRILKGGTSSCAWLLEDLNK